MLVKCSPFKTLIFLQLCSNVWLFVRSFVCLFDCLAVFQMLVYFSVLILYNWELIDRLLPIDVLLCLHQEVF